MENFAEWLASAIGEVVIDRGLTMGACPTGRWLMKHGVIPARTWLWCQTKRFKEQTHWQKVGLLVMVIYALTLGVAIGMGRDSAYAAHVALGGTFAVLIGITAVRAAMLAGARVMRRISA